MSKNTTIGAELRNARFAKLLGRASTPEAAALVDDITARISVHELANGKRSYQRRDQQHEAFREAVAAWLADILKAHVRPSPPARASVWVYRSMAAGAFTSPSYRHARDAIEGLHALGLVEISDSVGHWSADRVVRYWSKRFKATQGLLGASRRARVVPAEANRHFEEKVPALPAEPVQLRGAKSGNNPNRGVRGARLPLPDNAHTQRLLAQVRELNEYLAAQDIQGGRHEGYIRMFQNGDADGFAWDQGGRLYSQPGDGSYQHIGEDQRLRMTINREAVTEIDISASYLTLFLGLHGEQLPLEHDPYALPELPREVVKAWLTATFGSATPRKRWPKGAPLDTKRYKARLMGERVMDRYPLLRRWGEACHNGRVLTWAHLMYLESEAIVSTMLELARTNVPTLSVHDSLIVQTSKAELAADTLSRNFRQVAGGCSPKLTRSAL